MQQISKNIEFIGVPFRSGANREGAQFAPKWLIEHLSLSEDVYSILRLQSEDTPLTDTEICGVRNYNAVLRMINATRAKVTSVLFNQKKVVVLGGDHSIAMGSIAAVLENYSNVGVIWFDAHTDINTETSSPSGNAHGMPLAALMKLCKSEINTQGTKLNPSNLYWIGVRDIDEGELNVIKLLGIEDHVYTSEIIHQKGMKTVMKEIGDRLKKNRVEHLHLSFDIDGMDPEIVLATGTPGPNGVNEIEWEEFIYALSSNMLQIDSIDFVEYNPLLDNNMYATGKWCVKTLKQLIEIL